MALTVIVVNAVNVPKETFGKSDPYCELNFQGIKKKTEVRKDDENPEWGEKFLFDLSGVALNSSDVLKVNVFDWERVGRNKLLGECDVPLRDLLGVNNTKDINAQLMKAGTSQPIAGCTINLKLVYDPPKGAESGGDSGVGQVVGGVDSDSEPEVNGKKDENAAQMAEGSDDEEEEEVNDPSQPSGSKKKKKRKRKKVRGRRTYSSKVQDFQIRIKVVEGRQVPGTNINPVCRVTCYNQIKQTRIKKSTNAPYWNETFFFNFVISPAELFDELVSFEVFNSRRLRSDSLIGSFKCDLAMVYEENKHALIHKWLLLSDPDDTSSGARGYLKVCACILGPGDEAPSFKALASDEDQDIEANLLRPAGVMLRPATFKIKIYRAEDIPRMDSDFVYGVKKMIGLGDEKKELVDPYAIVSFAGKDVKTKIMYGNDHPEWNQSLNLKIKFPSMCEKIKLQVMDWDRIMNDDACGSRTLFIPEVSKSGETGFLPVFGPCYLNLYGSTREYSDLPNEYEDLNLGKGEGCAYRGRVLMEISTVLGEHPLEDVEDISNDDILKVQKYIRRRKYKLHAAFLDASMVTAIDAPVEFEVSIGNYGNKLDENVPPCSSTTQPTNAVFDGNYYYFLPWGETKPCAVVDCSWEDISFRLEALNLLQRITDRLTCNIENIKIGMKANLPIQDLAQLLIALLQQLVTDCKKPLPMPIHGQHVESELDIKMREYRASELENLVEEAKNLQESATDIEAALSDISGFLTILKTMTVEPQNSMPDVIIWMISGDKRIAYHRIPANEVLYSPQADYCGRLCGKLQSLDLKYPGNKAEKEGLSEVPALLRLKVWLGLEKHEMEWHHMQTEGDLAVFAETYENQVSILGTWTNKGPTMTRPKWSDVTGKVPLPKEMFIPPPGWRWDSEWYVSPELSLLFDKDAGHKSFLEDIFEFQARVPAGRWGSLSESWMNVKGDAVPPKEETALPEGWNWCDDWQVDMNRGVDEDGWEYCVEHTMGGYGPVEKNYHMCRRRRWVRPRELKVDQKKILAKRKTEISLSEGWEYAALFNMKFHSKERKMDLVRRRRWHRKMVAEKHGASCFFALETDGKDEDKYKTSLTAPRMFLTFKKSYKYQLRAYIYQARDLLAGDSNGLSDPFARISFLNFSGTTEKVDKTLCPTWDQTLIFEEIEIPGSPQSVAEIAPSIVVEIFDHDAFGSADFLGRAWAKPLVKLNSSDVRTPALQWYDIKKDGVYGGELLASFELFLMNGTDLPFLPPKKGDIFIVPSGIRPIMQRTGIEVLAWGVRNMKKFQLLKCTSPSVEFEISGNMLETSTIKSTKINPNFDVCTYFFDVMLPKEELYMPPMNVRVRDHRQFGRKPLVGIHTIKTLEPFRCTPSAKVEEIVDVDQDDEVPVPIDDEFVLDMPGTEEGLPEAANEEALQRKGQSLLDEEIDWWSKYYASIGDLEKCKKYEEKGFLPLQIIPSALEDVPDYEEFKDFCHTFELKRGKQVDDEESFIAGEFKGSFRIYPLPPDPSEPLPPKVFDNLPPSTPEECVVRVYIVRADDLQPMDPGGLADPYISIKLGKIKQNNRDEYIPNQLSPAFGKMFEMTTTIPIQKDLLIQVMDYDLLSTDDIIGETVIDLENRYLTKFRATCGLPAQYHISGPNAWRDSKRPREILEDYCAKNWMEPPELHGNNAFKVGNKIYKLSDFEGNLADNPHMGIPEERLALHILNTFPLVPEHIETRPLYNPLQPSIEQGKLQMWVDILPKSLGPPGPPCIIEPRVAKEYELRVIIWNTKDVILEETSITGEKMSDIYVKCWLAGVDEQQKTDVHYRSLDGEGNFNWRMKFPFNYLPAEQEMIINKKEHFWSLDTTEQKTAPILICQVWDNDKFSADDFLGTLELNLNAMPQPSKKSRNCSLDQLPDVNTCQSKLISLFEQRRVKGYWPAYSDESGTRELTGKIEMEIEVLTQEEVEQKPAGLGQDEPNMNPHLDPPQRPATSFLWFTSPWKTFKHIIWHNYKWYLLIAIILILVILLVILFIYSVPGASVDKLFGTG